VELAKCQYYPNKQLVLSSIQISNNGLSGALSPDPPGKKNAQGGTMIGMKGKRCHSALIPQTSPLTGKSY